MKKLWTLFVFPTIIVVLLFVFRENFTDFITRTALFLFRPSSALQYIPQQNETENAFDFELFPFSDNKKSHANPFEDFDINSLRTTPAPAVTPSFDTDCPIVELTYAPVLNDVTYRRKNCYVKNVTDYTKAEVETELLAPVDFKVEKNSELPQILIMHTHATESYLPPAGTAYDSSYAFRSTDTARNMVAVGKVMADTLNSLGWNTLQDATLHDYPSYNGSYDKSRDTVEKYLEKYPSIRIVLDIHRDAVERDGAIIAPTVTLDGAEYAQIMIISGRDNGYMNMPDYRQNLKFATMVQNQLGKDWPGLARPVLFDYRNYNQQLTWGSILVEIGTHGSTLAQAKRSGRAFAQSLAAALDAM